MEVSEISGKASALMPGIISDLEELVAIPSIAFPGYPEEPVHQMAERTLALFQDAGFTNARLMDVPTGFPPIYGEIKGPEGSPVVILYAHYDVQPAPPEQGWSTDPWVADPQGRPDLRARSRRRQGRAGGPPGHPAGLRRQAAVHGQAGARGDGGDREQPRGVRRGPSRAVRVRRLHRVRHGQPDGRRAGAHHRPARRRGLRGLACVPWSTRCTPGCSAARCPTP